MPSHGEADPAHEPLREARPRRWQCTGRRLLVALAFVIIVGLALMEVLTGGLGSRPFSPSVPYVGAALCFAVAAYYERDLVAALLAAAAGFLVFRVLDILVHGFLV